MNAKNHVQLSMFEVLGTHGIILRSYPDVKNSFVRCDLTQKQGTIFGVWFASIVFQLKCCASTWHAWSRVQSLHPISPLKGSPLSTATRKPYLKSCIFSRPHRPLCLFIWFVLFVVHKNIYLYDTGQHFVQEDTGWNRIGIGETIPLQDAEWSSHPSSKWRNTQMVIYIYIHAKTLIALIIRQTTRVHFLRFSEKWIVQSIYISVQLLFCTKYRRRKLHRILLICKIVFINHLQVNNHFEDDELKQRSKLKRDYKKRAVT